MGLAARTGALPAQGSDSGSSEAGEAKPIEGVGSAEGGEESAVGKWESADGG